MHTPLLDRVPYPLIHIHLMRIHSSIHILVTSPMQGSVPQVQMVLVLLFSGIEAILLGVVVILINGAAPVVTC